MTRLAPANIFIRPGFDLKEKVAHVKFHPENSRERRKVCWIQCQFNNPPLANVGIGAMRSCGLLRHTDAAEGGGKTLVHFQHLNCCSQRARGQRAEEDKRTVLTFFPSTNMTFPLKSD